MILEMLIAGTVAGACKSISMDEKALKKYAKAYEKAEEGQRLLSTKSELVDKRLNNVAKKKRAIIEYAIPKFIEINKKIRDLDIEVPSVNSVISTKIEEKLKVLGQMKRVVKRSYTDKELLIGALFTPTPLVLASIMVKDSKQFQSAANKQMSLANVQYEQALNMIEVLDEIEKKADRFSMTFATLNYMLQNILDDIENVISCNGKAINLYTKKDMVKIWASTEIIIALYKLMKEPILDNKGEIAIKAENLLIETDKRLAEINSML